MRLASLFGIRRDRRGVTVVEFALVAPVMLLMIMGLGELAYEGYVESVLTGAVQKAGRDSTIQGAAARTGLPIAQSAAIAIKTRTIRISPSPSRNCAPIRDIRPEFQFPNGVLWSRPAGARVLPKGTFHESHCVACRHKSVVRGRRLWRGYDAAGSNGG